MFTYFQTTLVRCTSFGVKRDVKRLFLPQVIERFHQDITISHSIQKDKHDKSAAKTRQNNHSETPYNTTFSLHFDKPMRETCLNNVKYVKNAILESNFEQLYRYCIEKSQFFENQAR